MIFTNLINNNVCLFVFFNDNFVCLLTNTKLKKSANKDKRENFIFIPFVKARNHITIIFISNFNIDA